MSMIIKTNIKTETYEIENDIFCGFMIDFIEREEKYEAYIYHKNYGYKEMILGVSKNDLSLEGFIEMIKGNLMLYISSFYSNVIEGIYE